MGLSDVLAIIENALRGLCGWLCEIIYPLIADAYQLFIDIGSLFYAEEFSPVYDKISLIIGIFMVFRVTFWLIEMLVNPDAMSDKEKNPGKIIKKIFIAVVLLATTPRIFKLAYNLQYDIVSNNVIERIISVNNADENESEIGKDLSASLFINFYTLNQVPSGVTAGNNYDNCEKFADPTSGTIYSNLKNEGILELTNYCLTARFDDDDKDSEYVINFNGLFAVVIGVIVLWMLLMYCISAGARYAQLIFLQIIAPIPIMCYLAPGKDNMFSKWVKQCTTTYLDLFIRIAIISFVLLLSQMLLTNENNILVSIGAGNSWLVNVFLVLGLLIFAKKAPDLIQELLPKSVTKASGDFGLSLKKRTDSMLGGKFLYNTAKRAPGYAAGGIIGGAVGLGMGIAGGKGVGSRIVGGLSGATRGFSTGSKKGNIFKNISEVKKNQAAQNNKIQQWRGAAGKGEDDPNTIGDYFSRKSASFKKGMGFETPAGELKRDTEFANKAADSYKSIIDFGSGKALEKNKQLNAFGVNRGIAELDAIQKRAVAEYQSTNAEKLLTSEEGKMKLKNISRIIAVNNAREEFINNRTAELKASGLSEADAKKQAELESKSKENEFNSKFETEYANQSEAERAKAAGDAVEYLNQEAIAATQEFDDYKKKAGFIHLVDEFNIGKDQNIKNEFKVMNEFLKTHPEIAAEFNLTPPGPDKDYFDAKTMNDLRLKAESGDEAAQEEFEKLFKSFDSFKTLKSIYVAKNTDEKALRDKANDGFSGK